LRNAFNYNETHNLFQWSQTPFNFQVFSQLNIIPGSLDEHCMKYCLNMVDIGWMMFFSPLNFKVGKD